MHENWIKILKTLSGVIKRAEFMVWFRDTALLQIEGSKANIAVPSIFAKEWIEKRYHKQILEVFAQLNLSVENLEFVVQTLTPEQKIQLPEIFGKVKTSSRKVNNKQEMRYRFSDSARGSSQIVSKMMNQKYTLENFVVGDNNRLAQAACQAVAIKPGHAYNPLFVYGNVGLGKTHLLQGTGNEILKNRASSVVVYVTAEKFTNEIIESIKKNGVKSFRNKYRNVDCLIIDDIQFLAGKGRTQEEFFHTFNELYHESKQIIISSDKPPKDLAGVEDRLVSRFEMGMIVDISRPDYETCLAILIQKSQQQQLFIDQEVLSFMAQNIQGSIRELEGILTQVVAQSKLIQMPASIEMVTGILQKMGMVVAKQEVTLNQHNPGSKMLSCKDVIETVACFYNLSRFDLVGERRSREIMIPRQVAIYILRKDFGYSYEKIGMEFGGRNHTTAMHACNKIGKALKKDLNLKKQLEDIKFQVGL